MKEKVLVLGHGDDKFIEELKSSLEGLDMDCYFEPRCPVRESIKYDYTPVCVIVNATSLNDENCLRHIKDMSKESIVLVAERESTVERFILMQVLGAKDYFHVPLEKENIRGAVMSALKLTERQKRHV